MTLPVTHRSSADESGLDLLEVGALDEHGRAGWPQVIAEQRDIIIGRLTAELHRLRAAAAYCRTCGGQPCINPSFCAACRRADERWRTRR